MIQRFRLLILAFFLTVAQSVGAQEDMATFGSGDTRMTVRSTTDIAIIRPVIERFIAENPDLVVLYEQWGSNELFANSRAVCEGGAEPADAVFSSAIHHMVWLVNAACAHRYHSAGTDTLPSTRQWRNELWGITEEPAVIIYNKRAIDDAEAPKDRFALLDLMRERPEFLRSRIATYDIEASGLGFLFALSDSLEATTFGAMLESFSRVEAIATCCSANIIEGVAEGRFYIAYNVLGSYVAAELRPDVGVILPEDYTLVLSRGFMIPKTATNKPAAERLLEFLLSPEAQDIFADIGLVMTQDSEESGLLSSSRRPIDLSPVLLVALDRNKRERLIALWRDAFRTDNLR